MAAMRHFGLMIKITGKTAYVLAPPYICPGTTLHMSWHHPIIGYAVGGEIVGKYIYDSFIKLLWWGSPTKI